MSATDIGERFGHWAEGEPAVTALIEIGSRVRADGDPASADRFSDWDFQVVTTKPELFAARTWLAAAGLQPRVYVFRLGRLGSAAKVTALFPEGELDLVIIPARRLRLARALVRLGVAQRSAGLRRGLGDLALVLRDGFRLRKGGPAWAHFLARVAREFVPPLLGAEELAALADGFVCDYVSTRRKIARGELLAAQRWLHHQLAETNFRLLHQLRRRDGAASYPDARRLEWLAPAAAGMVAVEAGLESVALAAAVRKSADTLRHLMRELVGDAWRWPDGID